MYGEADLAIAVIEQAIADTKSSSSYIRDEAIKFLIGKTKPWFNSLALWCNMAGPQFNPYEITSKYRKKFGEKVNAKRTNVI